MIDWYGIIEHVALHVSENHRNQSKWHRNWMERKELIECWLHRKLKGYQEQNDYQSVPSVDPPLTREEEERRRSRFLRFQGTLATPRRSSPGTDDAAVRNMDHTIVGTCTTLEKNYLRLTSVSAWLWENHETDICVYRHLILPQCDLCLFYDKHWSCLRTNGERNRTIPTFAINSNQCDRILRYSI